jgi:3-methyl-2-oxobutanoate hydroxymethyltransferase
MVLEEKEPRKKVTLQSLIKMKEDGKKAVFVTSYDYPTACRADRAGIDMILIGDSMGMTVYGHKDTLKMNMDIMIPHAEAVSSAVKYAFVIGDMPYMSYQPSNEEAVKNAARFISAGCSAVKCEGGSGVCERVKSITNAGILVMGHLGLTPQSMALFGGYKVQAREDSQIERLIEEALTLQEAGVFSILLEAVPPEAGKRVVEKLRIPIYGIGAGPYVDGQLLICHDLLGSFEGELSNGVKIPRFARKYGNIGELEEIAFRQYAEEVRNGKFPSEENFYKMGDEKNSCSERKK